MKRQNRKTSSSQNPTFYLMGDYEYRVTHTTEKREEWGNSIQAEVLYNRATRKYSTLFYLRGRRIANVWGDNSYRDFNAAIRYAEVTVANYNL